MLLGIFEDCTNLAGEKKRKTSMNNYSIPGNTTSPTAIVPCDWDLSWPGWQPVGYIKLPKTLMNYWLSGLWCQGCGTSVSTQRPLCNCLCKCITCCGLHDEISSHDRSKECSHNSDLSYTYMINMSQRCVKIHIVARMEKLFCCKISEPFQSDSIWMVLIYMDENDQSLQQI